MAARAPLDVDLEDKLLYGLTPMRLGYVVLALLVAFSIWSGRWAPGALRGAIASLVVGVGAAAAWGRWRGRAADAWMLDLVAFMVANYRFERRWPDP